MAQRSSFPQGERNICTSWCSAPDQCTTFGYGAAPQIGLVSITTKHPHVPFDSTCVIAVGEHDFIKHESYVLYRGFRLDSVDHAHARIADHVWNEHLPCSAALIERIRTGVCASRFVPGEFRRIYGC